MTPIETYHAAIVAKYRNDHDQIEAEVKIKEAEIMIRLLESELAKDGDSHA